MIGRSAPVMGGGVPARMAAATPETPRARLRWEIPAPGKESYATEGGSPLDAGAATIPLGRSMMSVVLKPSPVIY